MCLLRELRGGGVASEALWTAGTLKGSAIGALDSFDGVSRLAELKSVLALSAATIVSSAVCAGEFCNGDGEGRSVLVGSVETAYQREMKVSFTGY